MKTFVVGIGAPRAGTTWLYAYLYAHPEVYMSPIKELHYWDWRYRPDLCSGVHENFREQFKQAQQDNSETPGFGALEDRLRMASDEAAYMGFFEARVSDERVFGEITPGYSLLPIAGFRQLRAQHERPRLIFLLRDPVDRLWSAICFAAIRRNLSPATEFYNALSDPNYIERARYDITLGRVDAVFPEEEMFIEFYENLFTEAAIERLTSFLGIEYLQPNFERRFNAYPKPPLLPAHERVARETLAPVYDYCRKRFGRRLPNSWR